MINLLLAALLIIGLQLVKILQAYQKKHQQSIRIQEQGQYYLNEFSFSVKRDFAETGSMQSQNQIAYHLYSSLGQSISALQIQLQVAQKLWQTNPSQAQSALLEAYELSSTVMQEIRQTVRTLKQESPTEPSQTTL